MRGMQEDDFLFGLWDYVIFVIMLVASSSVGIYFAFKKSGSINDKMSLFPVSMSLIATLISGVNIFGIGTEIYFYGTKHIFMWLLGVIISSVVSAYIFLPVYHDMKISLAYEYLERRFDKKCRLYATVTFILSWIAWLPIEMYVASIAFNQVTGVNRQVTAVCLCSVCIFYTIVGGFKAVIWADVIQCLIMAGAMTTIILKGSSEIGGFNTVWQKNLQGSRIEIPSIQVDFTDRHSIWSTSIGSAVSFIHFASFDQNAVQRFTALPTFKKIKSANWIFTVGTLFFALLSCASGLVIYATYYDCDPFTTELITAKDQIFPLFVKQILGNYPGMAGLFIAGIISAGLSTFSSGLNSMAVVLLHDVIKIIFPNKVFSDRVSNIIIKCSVIFFGALSLALIFLVEKLGTVMQLAMSILSITLGPSFGMFCGGMLLPWMNADGIFYGALTGLGATGFVVFGAEAAIATGQLQWPTKPLSIENCDYYHNGTLANITSTESDVFPLFKMSYLWYSSFGAIVTIVFGITISYFTGFNDPSNINPLCLSPVIRKYLPKRKIPENEELLQPN